MDTTLFDWLLSLIYEMSYFSTWLTSQLPLINISPLALFGYTGITLLISWHLTRLIIGG